MILSVKSASEQAVQVEVADTATVSDLKNAIQSATQVAPQDQRLIFAGKVLKDTEPLATYKLQTGHTLHLVRGKSTSSISTSATSATSAAPAPTPSATTPNTPTPMMNMFNQNPMSAMNQMPQMNQMAGLSGMMQNPQMMAQMSQMMQNPQMMEQMSQMMQNPQFLQMMTANQPPEMRAAVIFSNTDAVAADAADAAEPTSTAISGAACFCNEPSNGSEYTYGTEPDGSTNVWK